MASRKVIRRLGALLHPSRGFCHKQELGGQLHPRSSSQLLAALEPHVTSSGKELFQVLIDVFCLEKEAWKQKEEFWKKKEAWKQEEEFWKQKEAWKQKDEYQKEACKQKQKEIEYQNKEIAYLEVDLLRSKGLNNTCGLFERMQEVLATYARAKGNKASILWEKILKWSPDLAACVEKHTNIPPQDVRKQAVHCHTIYNILSQHVHAGPNISLYWKGGEV
ncbi:hypothetical protein GOP47_0001089 [Adiantum capillus-veneris]|uniref:Uncharacterized protein n=1 Tax=Adiantum capillus-veneris TaxID=13818 RepID=A0A9D4VF60_ADICA|nr:hypothetical protein GOP47_0001089 [Adiantum capillus-veneris]